MTSGGIKMGMTPPHPGVFIRIEALEELGLSVSAAAWRGHRTLSARSCIIPPTNVKSHCVRLHAGPLAE